MSLNIKESSEAIEYVGIIQKIIDGAKISIQEEFSKGGNNRTACFASITETLDNYRGFVQKHIDKEDYNKVDKKIEELKTELWNLREKYTEKDKQPNTEEKESLFKHLVEIKKMIE